MDGFPVVVATAAASVAIVVAAVMLPHREGVIQRAYREPPRVGAPRRVHDVVALVEEDFRREVRLPLDRCPSRGVDDDVGSSVVVGVVIADVVGEGVQNDGPAVARGDEVPSRRREADAVDPALVGSAGECHDVLDDGTLVVVVPPTFEGGGLGGGSVGGGDDDGGGALGLGLDEYARRRRPRTAGRRLREAAEPRVVVREPHPPQVHLGVAGGREHARDDDAVGGGRVEGAREDGTVRPRVLLALGVDDLVPSQLGGLDLHDRLSIYRKRDLSCCGLTIDSLLDGFKSHHT